VTDDLRWALSDRTMRVVMAGAGIEERAGLGIVFEAVVRDQARERHRVGCRVRRVDRGVAAAVAGMRGVVAEAKSAAAGAHERADDDPEHAKIVSVIPRVVIERVSAPGGELVLARRGDEYSLRLGNIELMNSRNHLSEDELGRLACPFARGRDARVLIGGLGLGYTLRAVLDGCAAQIDVAEIVPAVVRWARGVTADLAGRPLDDPRVTVIEGDVSDVVARSTGRYHAIVLDVDNGPDELLESNAKLYKRRGLEAAKRALVRGGAFLVWSSFDSKTFTRWLRDVGYTVEVKRLDAHGTRHFIWLAKT
jgi:spermidine synthase